jgi:hypothetical protein
MPACTVIPTTASPTLHCQNEGRHLENNIIITIITSSLLTQQQGG